MRTPVSNNFSAGPQPIDWRRLRGPTTAIALGLAAASAILESISTVIAGQLAAGPSWTLLVGLSLCALSPAILDALSRVLWSSASDRAEGKLRDDLVGAVWAQPVHQLAGQAAGEILDRVDDDTYDVGLLSRHQLWSAIRTIMPAIPLWIIGGLTWWPAWFAFPVVGVVTWLLVQPLMSKIAERKVAEEVAWSDHAAIFEEGVAARDDLRTSLGAAFILRRSTELSAEVLRLVKRVMSVQTQMLLRSGFLLNGLLAGVAVVGVDLVLNQQLTVAQLVTLFLVTTSFTGQIAQLAQQLPELQAGMGAVLRLRQLLGAEREPADGAPMTRAPLDISIDGLEFSYPEGTFSLRVDDLHVPAGNTLALVGRSGSGKSTLASLLSRAVEPPPGTVTLAGTDVRDYSLDELRRSVGVVTQRTEIVAGTLAENIALFADLPRGQIEAAIAELGLTEWVASLDGDLDAELGPGGITLSGGEEQLVAFARLLVRDVRVIVLDEATARMDPQTEQLVVHASARLLHGRTGLIIAHRLTTTRRADYVAVLAAGEVIEYGAREDIERGNGPYRKLLDDAGATFDDTSDILDHASVDGAQSIGAAAEPAQTVPVVVGTARRRTTAPDGPDIPAPPRLATVIRRALLMRPAWGLTGGVLLGLSACVGAYGPITAFIWGELVQTLDAPAGDQTNVWPLTAAFAASAMAWTVLFPLGFYRFFPWLFEISLRVRTNVLIAQTAQRRLPRRSPGEVVARALDADRLSRYADRWIDFINGMAIIVITTVLSGSLLAGAVLVVVLAAAALASSLGRSIAGRSAAQAATARAAFGRALVSALEATRTVKLAAATDSVHAHLRRVDAGRVDAAVREHRVQAALDGVPMVIVQCGVITAWAVHLLGGWDLATAVMLSVTVVGFDWFGLVTGWVVTEAPGTRAWQRETSTLAGGSDLIRLPPGVDLVTGTAPAPPVAITQTPLQRLSLDNVSVIHEDGTIGVEGVSLQTAESQLVLLVGGIGSGKSSLLRALAGLVDHTGEIRWNDKLITDVELFCRPGQVAYVAQLPRVLSGSYADNIMLDHCGRDARTAADAARLGTDLAAAGGLDTIVGHRGVRLSGGQIQRLALARALATEAELVLADDISSALDASTELELWATLRERGITVIGSTSKRVALQAADTVLVLDQGRVVARGPWRELERQWSHLAG